MTCHSQIWSTSPMLEPVRTSLATKQPMVWTRVHNLPDFVYFNHAIHIQKGIGCVSCHGRVDQMPMMWKEEPMTMEWCLDCHRHPEHHLREKREVFNMEWAPPVREQLEIGRELDRAEAYRSGSIDQLLGVPSMKPRPDADPTSTDVASVGVELPMLSSRPGLLAEPGGAGRAAACHAARSGSRPIRTLAALDSTRPAAATSCA